MLPKGSLFVLVGPSGSGKNTIIDEILHRQPHLQQLATATTRPRRENETEGVEHLFVSPDEFQQLITDNALIEYQRIHNAWYYGTPRSEVERIINHGERRLADIDVYGAEALKAAYPNEVVVIFISPPNAAALEERIRERDSENEAQIQTRLARAGMEMQHVLDTDYVVVNDTLEIAVELVENLITQQAPTQLFARAWVTKVPDDGMVYAPNGTLPRVEIDNRDEAADRIKAYLADQHQLATEPSNTTPQTLWYRQNGTAELIVPLHTLQSATDWAKPQALDIPFHLMASLAARTAISE